MSSAVQTEARPGERKRLSAEIKIQSDKNDLRKENIELISMSRSGAGFYLTEKCEVGRLVSLSMPMPKHLRCYDFEKDTYLVWGLVQHCNPVSFDGVAMFHVGVAFAGQDAPPSYHENALQSYRITGMNENGTWRIVEAKADFVVRRHRRHWFSLGVLLSAFDENGKLILDEAAKTENISVSGAAVFSNMPIDVGDSVTVDSIAHNFSSLAIVRNRQTLENEPPRLHLEFIGRTFPLKALDLPDEIQVSEDR